MMVTVVNPCSSSSAKTLTPSSSQSSFFAPTLILHRRYCLIIPSKSFGQYTLTRLSAAFLQTPTTTRCQSSNSSTHGNLFSLFHDIGLNEKETQLLLEKNPSLPSTSLESLHNRISLLQSVGIQGLALCRVIAKRPNVLTADEVESLLCYLHNDLQGNIEPGKLEKLLWSEPSVFAGFARKVGLLQNHGIPPDKLIHVLNSVGLSLTKAFCFKSVEEIERTLVYLNRFGGVELITRRPALLNFDLNSQLIPRIEFFVELSWGDVEATGAVLRKLPAIITYSVNHLQSQVQFLRSFAGLNDQQIFKVIQVYPNVVSTSKERKLQPRIEFLKQCGLDSDDIYKFLTRAPLFLGLSFRKNLSKKLGFLVKIGYKEGTKDLAVAMGALCRTSLDKMQMVIGIFLHYGLSCEDILAMSRKHPQILQYNPQSLEMKMEYLIEEIGRDIGELLAFPAFLGYKLDDRIKHRYEVKRKLLGEGMSLNKLLSVSADRFSRRHNAIQIKTDLHKEEIEETLL